MSKHLLPAPDLTAYRWALYCRGDLLGLALSQQPPIALYRDEASAIAHGQLMWPSAYSVIDLHGEDSPCGRPN
ncbi:hypothetical protein N5F23_00480 [Pseudomonas sichuanensis]|uniref:hypothetical protein n=1 Tax=Pseudomonas sichuanensis TaxID=2213015 RepID=UPI00244AD20B|nr:hypothetical protein [Pseudomonas sichuanensis]MDH0730955.1 hypothetical protein [Pseudomonas sichuanensis]MDH1581068.1 hypothetical protein [Pseudomonas sichuanensis]MDH1591071.1 hypothetical protein [Pseudomonas sichuanensis]MDH1596740.1 hypothetical protein [Pseudomonas sichuanensis]